MNESQGMQLLIEVVKKLHLEGFITSGEIRFVRPLNHGLVDTIGEVYLDSVPRLKLTTRSSGGADHNISIRPAPASPPSLKAAPTGDICDHCGSAKLVRHGTCKTCHDCGSTSGCG